MPRESIGATEVWQAAEALLDRGESPTIERVRSLLGRGSNSTIAPLLRRWKEEHHSRGSGGTAPEAAHSPPPGPPLVGLEGQLEGFLGRIVRELRSEAEREIAGIRREASEERERLQNELNQSHQDAREREIEMQHQLAAAEAARHALENICEQLERRLETVELASGALSQQLSEGLRQSADTATTRLRELGAELTTRTTHIEECLGETERTQKEHLETQLARHAAEFGPKLEALAAELPRAQVRLDQLRLTLDQQAEARRTLESQLLEARTSLRAAQRELKIERGGREQVSAELGRIRREAARSAHAFGLERAELQREIERKARQLEGTRRAHRSALERLRARAAAGPRSRGPASADATRGKPAQPEASA